MRRSVLVCSTLGTVLALQAGASGQTAEQANRARAQGISLGGAIEVAVRKSPDLARTKVDRAIADAETVQASGLDDWVITASGTWLSSRAGEVDGAPFQTLGTDNVSGTGALTRGLRSGGTVGLHADAGFTRNEFGVLTVDAMDPSMVTNERFKTKATNLGLAASISQPLLRGRGERIARATQRRAVISRDRATLSRQSSAITMIQNIVSAYWELAYAARELEIRQSSVKLATEQLRITKAAKEVGSKAASDVRAIEHGIAVREQAVLQAKINLSERSLELRRLAGLPIGVGNIDLASTDALRPTKRTLDLDEALRLAKQRNPRLALVRLSAKSATIDEELARDATRASLEISGRIGPTGNATKAGDAFTQFATFDSFTATATLSYRQTLKNRAARGALKRTRLLRRKLRLDLAVSEREIAVQVVRAVNLVRLARMRIEVADKAIKLAEKNHADEKIRFGGNEATNFDVLQRLDEIQKAKLDHARAVVDYLKSLGNVDALTGELLNRYGVKLL